MVSGSSLPVQAQANRPPALDVEADEAALPSQSSIPWTTGCRLGAGVDALTGRILGDTVADFPLELPANQSGDPVTYTTSMHMCHDSASTMRSFYKDLRVSMQLDLANTRPIPPLGVAGHSTSSSFDSVRHSSDTFSLVLRSDVIHSPRVLYTRPYRLLDTAEAVLKERGAAEFRTRFGDYFISGHQIATRLEAVLRVKCNDAQSRSDMMSSIGMSLQSTVASDLSRDAGGLSRLFASDVVVEMRTFAEHVSAKAVTPPEIITTAARMIDIWNLLLKDPPSQPVIAILQPCYRIQGIAEAVLPKSIPVPPEVFATLERLRSLLVSCSRTLAALPSFHSELRKDSLRAEVEQLNRAAIDAVGSPHDSEAAKALVSSAQALEGKIFLLAAMHELYESLLQLKGSPLQSRLPVQHASQMRWYYGRQEAAAPIIIHATEVRKVVATKRLSELPWRRSFQPFRVSQLDSSATSCRVTGLMIKSVNGRGCWKALSPILLNGVGSLELLFSSGMMHRGVWEVTVYYVDDATLADLAKATMFEGVS